MIERKNIKTIRLNDKEMYDLKKRSLLSGLSESSVIRLALRNQPIKPNPPKELKLLLIKINNIGININQIAKIANQTGEIYYNDLKIYYSEIEKLMNEIKSKYL